MTSAASVTAVPVPRRTLLRIAFVLVIHALVLLALLAGDHVPRWAPPQIVMLMTMLPPAVVRPPPPPPPRKKPRSPVHEAAAPRLRDLQVPPRTDVVPIVVDEAAPLASAGGTPDGTGTAGAGQVGAGAGGAAAGPVTVGALIDPANCPPIPDFSDRPYLVGTVILAVRVGVDGRVSDARIAKSSGRALLDKTALEGARHCRFEPATVDHVPVASWEAFRYSWTSR